MSLPTNPEFPGWLTTCDPGDPLLLPSGARQSIGPSLHILVPLGNRAQELLFGTCREMLLLIGCLDHCTTQFKPEQFDDWLDCGSYGSVDSCAGCFAW
jgi:hypothetical protein